MRRKKLLHLCTEGLHKNCHKHETPSINEYAPPDTHKDFQPAIKLVIKTNLKNVYFAMDKVLNIAVEFIIILLLSMNEEQT